MKVLNSGLVAGMLAAAALPAAAAEWFPVDVLVTGEDGVEASTYTPPEAASEAWDICASLPHLKDPYWLAVNYGLTQEAERLGVNLIVNEAGGYTNLAKQISQIEDCAVTGADAVLIGAISGSGLDSLIAELDRQGIVVIDFMNGVSSDKVMGRSLVSFETMGEYIGKYLAEKHPEGSGEVQVAWFPGPAGASWVEAGNTGFVKALEGSDATLFDTRYGDTGKEVQLKLVEDSLQSFADLDYIVGTAPTAESAAQVLKARGLDGQIDILSYYITPGILDLMEDGVIAAAPTDSTVLQARIAVDLAVGALEGDTEMHHLGPVPMVVTSDALGEFDPQTTVAPAEFSPVFKVSQ